jgi:hypothetical protein
VLDGICEYRSQNRRRVARCINFAARSGFKGRKLSRDLPEPLHRLRIN